MTVKITWTPNAVKRMAQEIVLERAEDVGKFCETDARRRLDAITDPDTKRDKNYRKYLSDWILTNTVEKDKFDVLIRIGMKVGKEGQMHHGFYIETGSSTAQAHPFLRPSVFSNARDIVDLLGD